MPDYTALNALVPSFADGFVRSGHLTSDELRTLREKLDLYDSGLLAMPAELYSELRRIVDAHPHPVPPMNSHGEPSPAAMGEYLTMTAVAQGWAGKPLEPKPKPASFSDRVVAVVGALLAKPKFGWQVFQGLVAGKLLSPWEDHQFELNNRAYSERTTMVGQVVVRTEQLSGGDWLVVIHIGHPSTTHFETKGEAQAWADAKLDKEGFKLG
jgi:hypothetical protein